MARVSQMVIDAVESFAEQAQEWLPCSYVYLFGSHARGCPRPGSDIDVAILIPEVPGRDENPRRIEECRSRMWMIGSQCSDDMSAHLIESQHDVTGFAETVVNTGICIAKPKAKKNEILPQPEWINSFYGW